MKYKKTILPNGLRIITAPTTGNPAVTVLVIVEAGSNYETGKQSGISHFLEHMCFKGTTRRPTPLDVALELDQIGAENNAFTSNEWTGYYAKAEKKHFGKILDVVSDIYLHSKLEDQEIEKEKGVILQEISMYEDKPQSLVWDLSMKLLYGDTPAGRPVIGSPKNVKNFSRADILKYRKEHYVASSTIVVVAGDIDHKTAISGVKKYFAKIPVSKKTAKSSVRIKQRSPRILLKKKDIDQVNMMISFRSYRASDKRHAALSILAGVLGSGMSSRLWQRVRTKMGAAYFAYASNNSFSNYGDFFVATGIDKMRIEEVTKAILEECSFLARELVPQEELKKTKDYIIGHLYMGLETTDSLAHFYGIDEAVYGSARQVSEVEKSIRAVTARDVQKVAKEIFQTKNLNLAVVGDVKNQARLKKLLVL